ncbi:MAG: hypothetical protein ACTSPB_19535, partial [Candidatus Thorarchaeota archaeon]
VPSHAVLYKNKRVVRIRPKLSKFERGQARWVTIDRIRARKGQLFFTRAIRQELPHLVDDLKMALSRLGKVRSV